MEEKEKIVLPIYNRQKFLALIADGAIFEFKESSPNKLSLLITLNKNTYLRLQMRQNIGSQMTRFIIKVYDELKIVELVVEGKQLLQKVYRKLGKQIYITGLQEIVTNFRKIGEGSFASVYQATTNYGVKMALKCFEKKSFIQNLKNKKSFFNEIEVLKILNSPYIIHFDYIYESEKAYYIKMQYIKKTLKERMAEKMLVRDQKMFMKQLLIALRDMKAKNIIHRDLKPQNIMVRVSEKRKEECVIIDFGLGTFANQPQYLYVRCGTPGFLSPQIANMANKKERQSSSSDMFSLGCIFYKMLTGRYLFYGKNVKQVLQKNRNCQINDNLFKGLSVNQETLLRAMIEKNPLVRITPEQALQHPYFQAEVDDEDQIPDEQSSMYKNIKKCLQSYSLKNMQTINSSAELLIQSSNNCNSNVFKMKQSIKDSCVTFQFQFKQGTLGKQNCEDNMLSSKSPNKLKRASRFSKIDTNLIKNL